MGRVGPLPVIEPEPVSDLSPGFQSCFELHQVHLFVFQGTPQSLDEHVVQAAAFAVHRDLDPGLSQDAGEGVARELTPLVGVEDFRLAEAGQGFFQGLDAEVRVHRVGQAP